MRALVQRIVDDNKEFKEMIRVADQSAVSPLIAMKGFVLPTVDPRATIKLLSEKRMSNQEVEALYGALKNSTLCLIKFVDSVIVNEQNLGAYTKIHTRKPQVLPGNDQEVTSFTVDENFSFKKEVLTSNSVDAKTSYKLSLFDYEFEVIRYPSDNDSIELNISVTALDDVIECKATGKSLVDFRINTINLNNDTISISDKDNYYIR